MGTNGGLCNSGQSRLEFSRLGRRSGHCRFAGAEFSFYRSFPLISALWRSGHCRLQGLIFRLSGHFPPFGGADIAGLQGLIFRFPSHSLSFPLISRHSGNSGVAAGSRQTRRDFRWVVYVIRYRHSTNVRKGTPSVVDIAPMLERGHQAWQGANDTSFSSKCDCPGVQLLILRLRVCAGLDLRLAGSRYTM